MDGCRELDVVTGTKVDSGRLTLPDDSSAKSGWWLFLGEPDAFPCAWVSIVTGERRRGRDCTYSFNELRGSTSIGGFGEYQIAAG